MVDLEFYLDPETENYTFEVLEAKHLYLTIKISMSFKPKVPKNLIAG
jgi:hypothetical protein